MTKRSLLSSIRIQLRVIGALYLREIITRYGRNNIGFLWLFVEPMLFILAISSLWTATKDAHGFKLPITAFAVTGYSSMLLWRNMISRCSGAMTPNIGLLFHRNVKVLDIFASRILLEFAGASLSFVGISLIFISLGLMEPPEDVLKVIFGWMLLTWFGSSMALVIGSLSERSELVDKIWGPLSYLLMPLSGLAFMVDWLAPTMQKVVLYLPMVHGVEILREGYFGKAVRSHYDLSYLVMFCLLLTLFGLVLARETARQMNPS